MSTIEVWKELEGFNGQYLVSYFSSNYMKALNYYKMYCK